MSDTNGLYKKFTTIIPLQIRVSAEISNGPIILNLDCDMYSNDSDSIREALCFFMDEEKGYKTSYVQYPQRYYNINKNDTYSNIQRVVHEVSFEITAKLLLFSAKEFCWILKINATS